MKKKRTIPTTADHGNIIGTFFCTPCFLRHWSSSRCVMALPAELGERVKVILAHCNFMVDCIDCWFDDGKVW